MASTTALYGVPEEFLSRQAHLDFRAMTKLIGVISGGLPEGAGSSSVLNPKALSREERSRMKIFKALCQLLVREHEIVAIVLQKAGLQIIPRVLATSNPRREEAKEPLSTSGAPALLAEDLQSEQKKPHSQHICQWFLEQLRAQRNGNKLYPFRFVEHCHILVDLLQRLHDDPESPEAMRDFVWFALMATTQKVTKRFNGDSARRRRKVFPDYIERPYNDRTLPDTHYSKYPRGLDNDRWPDAMQAGLLAKLLSQFLTDGDISSEEAERFGWNAATENFDATKPVYDEEGRKRFQAILRIAFKRARTSLQIVNKELQNNLPKNREKHEPLGTASEKLKDAMEKLSWDMACWHVFGLRFRSTMREHMKWFENVFELTETTVEKKPRTSRKAGPISTSEAPLEAATSFAATKSQTSAKSQTFTKSQTSTKFQTFTPPTQVPDADDGAFEAFEDTHDHEDTPDNGEDVEAPEEEPEISDVESEASDDQAAAADKMYVETQQGWAARGVMWLKLTTQYHRSTEILLPSNSSLDVNSSTSVKNIKVNTIWFEPEYEDSRMIPLFGILEKFMDDLKVKAVDRDEVRKWLQEKCIVLNDKNAETELAWFGGTWHCEAIHFAMASLAELGDDDYQKIIDHNPARLTAADQSLRLPDDHILAMYRSLDRLIMVSKRCCPVCNQLLRSVDSIRFVFPGHHGTWTPVSLPPLVRKNQGEHVMDFVAAELRRLFGASVVHLRPTKQDDETTQPTPTGRRQSDSDASMMSNDTEDDEGSRKGKPKRSSSRHPRVPETSNVL